MKLYQIDAFTSKAFSGNPAGVAIVDDFPEEMVMQNIAMEMNLSETAFMKNVGKNKYDIRFFTPSQEIDLCGHASLSCAHILFSQNMVSYEDEIVFTTKGGELNVIYNNGKYSITFPKWELRRIDDIQKAQIITGLPHIDEVYDTKVGWKILLVKDFDTLLAGEPNFSRMKETEYGNIAVTCRGEREYDYSMRCFVTDCGINEDPVTGSIECILAPFWSQKLGKTSMVSYQASSRGGEKFLDVKEKSIVISGNAITVLEIELLSN